MVSQQEQEAKEEGSTPPPLRTDEPPPALENGEPIPYTIYTSWQKAFIVFIVSLAATFTAFSSNIYFPAIPTIAIDLHVSNELINLTITSYMIFQGLSPTLWGGMADVWGRRITYMITFIIYFGTCIGLAETKNFATLLILRCLQSTGSASTIAIGAGVVGDITMREERGGYMGLFQAGLLAPLAIGPILGGVFSQTLGWRAIFWFLTIYSGTFLIFLVIFLPETLRSLVGNGSVPPKGLAKSPLAYIQRRRRRSSGSLAPPEKLKAKKSSLDLGAPLRILFAKEAICMVIFLSIYYTVWQMTVAAMSTFFKDAYGLTEIQIGLTFIANGVGCILGTLLIGKILDFHYRKIKAKFTGEPHEFSLEKARFGTIWYWVAMECISIIVFGWTLEKNVHISVPIICTFFLGFAATAIQSVVTTFLVDIFHNRSASAVAALNFSRCLMGAGGTAAVLPISDAINIGWTFTLFTGIMLASIGLVFVQMTFGARWRRAREQKQEEEKS